MGVLGLLGGTGLSGAAFVVAAGAAVVDGGAFVAVVRALVTRALAGLDDGRDVY